MYVVLYQHCNLFAPGWFSQLPLPSRSFQVHCIHHWGNSSCEAFPTVSTLSYLINYYVNYFYYYYYYNYFNYFYYFNYYYYINTAILSHPAPTPHLVDCHFLFLEPTWPALLPRPPASHVSTKQLESLGDILLPRTRL